MMNTQIVAVLISEGGRFISEMLRTRPRKIYVPEPEPLHLQPEIVEPTPSADSENKATQIATGCIPCALGHVGTCSGLLNESMRFAYKDGVSSTEVIDRANMCLDELNTMERVDLRPEMIAQLPAWEKDLANKALVASRETRHKLESLTSVDDLEQLAASTQTLRSEIGRAWFQAKLKKLSPEEKKKIQERVISRLESEEEL